MRRNSLCRRHHPAIDYDNTVVQATQHLLHNHVLRYLHGDIKGLAYLLLSAEIKRHSAPLISVERLDDDRRPRLMQACDCLFTRAYNAAARRRKSGVSE